MTDTHRIVMAVIHRRGRVLLCHRHPDREWYPDVWDLPGGHVEDDETEANALRRELLEELGIGVETQDEPLVGARFGDVDALVWAITDWRGEVSNAAPDEHDEIGWFAPDEFDGLALADPTISELCRLALSSG